MKVSIGSGLEMNGRRSIQFGATMKLFRYLQTLRYKLQYTPKIELLNTVVFECSLLPKAAETRRFSDSNGLLEMLTWSLKLS